jgi:tRNA(Ile)-lysidine synthase
MPHSFEARITADWPPDTWRDVTVVAAVSGGADSVALLRALAAVRVAGAGRLVVAHFNHHLRGEESDSDEKFVRELGESRGLPVIVGHDTPQPLGDRLFEERCRQARYQFFEQTAASLGARYVALAHTADDHVETILHRIIRGTGLRGLAGIPRTRPLSAAATIVRPLLSTTRDEVLTYLSALGQPYHSDSTNALLHGTRNRIRLDLLPHLAEQYNPQVKKALLQLGQLASETQRLVDQLVDEVLHGALIRRDDQSLALDCRKLRDRPRLLVRECLVQAWRGQGWSEQSMSFSHWQALADLALGTSEVETQVFPGGILARRQGGQLRLDEPARG